MKLCKKLSYAILMVLGKDLYAQTTIQSQNFILGRSVTNADQALEFALLNPTNKFNNNELTFNVAAAGLYKEYVAFSKIKGLGAAPLWSGKNEINTTMSKNQATNVKDATYFSIDQLGLGLQQNQQAGTISLNPIAYQAGTTLMAELEKGVWFVKARANMGKASIDPQLKGAKEISASANNLYDQYIFDSAAESASPYANLEEAFKGGKNIINSASSKASYLGLAKGKIDGINSTKFMFGDINLAAGVHAINSDTAQLDVAVRGVIPAGNKATGECMLEAIYGNGGYVQLGGQLSGNFELWRDEKAYNSAYMHFDVVAMHSFANSKSSRSFDLTNNGKGSKYLLVADYNGGTAQEVAQNLINVSTLQVKSSFAAEVNGMLSFGFKHKGLSCNLGLDAWVRSKESLSITGAFDAQRWAVLGQQKLFGANAACQPNATMGNLAASISSSPATGAATDVTSVNLATEAANRISGVDALNVAAATQTLAATAGIFANIDYQWEYKNLTPHVGIHGSCECSMTGNNNIPQAGIAFILGAAF